MSERFLRPPLPAALVARAGATVAPAARGFAKGAQALFAASMSAVFSARLAALVARAAATAGKALSAAMAMRLSAALLLWSATALADGSAAPAGAAPPKPSFLEQFFPFILIGLVFYFLIIRPQQRKAKRHEGFLGGLKKGDEVVTASGFFGKIEGLTDRFVILEIAKDVRVRILKSKIASSMKEFENKSEKPSVSSEKPKPRPRKKI